MVNCDTHKQLLTDLHSLQYVFLSKVKQIDITMPTMRKVPWHPWILLLQKQSRAAIPAQFPILIFPVFLTFNIIRTYSRIQSQFLQGIKCFFISVCWITFRYKVSIANIDMLQADQCRVPKNKYKKFICYKKGYAFKWKNSFEAYRFVRCYYCLWSLNAINWRTLNIAVAIIYTLLKNYQFTFISIVL